MTPNDAQIDLLLRSHSRKANSPGNGAEAAGDRVPEHLDADELNAFAEGMLPAATRARYVSHLADCDRCRKLVTQVTMAIGSTEPARVAAVDEVSERASLWQKFRDVFALAKLRYAAFALVLIAAVGVTFLALRSERESRRLTGITEVPQSQDTAVRQPEQPGSAGASSETGARSENRSATSTPAVPSHDSGTTKNKSEEVAASAPPLKETELAKSGPVVPSKRAEPAVSEVVPSYAPPPPNERADTASSGEKDLKAGVAASQPAPKPSQADDEFRNADRARAEENARGREMNIDRARARKGGPSRNEVANNKSNAANTQAPAANNRETQDKQAGESSRDQSRTQGLVFNSTSAASEERKVGGRSFRRQGSAWVDTKFKSSMSVTDIKRGSDEFRALDSGLRSIADQLGKEVVVVWKGKAYRIR